MEEDELNERVARTGKRGADYINALTDSFREGYPVVYAHLIHILGGDIEDDGDRPRSLERSAELLEGAHPMLAALAVCMSNLVGHGCVIPAEAQLLLVSRTLRDAVGYGYLQAIRDMLDEEIAI
jgi:hypothetical protein